MMDPKSANDYDDVGAQAVFATLLEIGQVLGAYRDKFVIIGGAVDIPAHVKPAFRSM